MELKGLGLILFGWGLFSVFRIQTGELGIAWAAVQ